MNRQQISPSEATSPFESYSGKLKRAGRAAFMAGSLLLAACSGGGSSESSAPTTEKERVITTTSDVPTSTTTEATTDSPEVKRQPVGEYEFLGAVEIIRKSNMTPGVDDHIAHRLNNGGIVTHPDGSQESTGDPMLGNGSVVSPSSGILDADGNQIAGVGQVPLTLGEPGKTTVMSAHNVTDIDAPVTINGVTYNHSDSMLSAYNNAQMENGTDDFKPNLSPGDLIVTTVNNADGTATRFTYEVQSIYVIDADDTQAVKNMYLPPKDPKKSVLRKYWCWTPGSDLQRQVAEAVLVGTEGASPIPDPGEQPPDWSAEAN